MIVSVGVTGHTKPVRGLAFAAHGHALLSASDDQRVNVHEMCVPVCLPVPVLSVLHCLLDGSIVRSFEPIPDRHAPLSRHCSVDGTLTLPLFFQLLSSVRLSRGRNALVSTYDGHSSWVLGVAASPDGRHFASWCVALWLDPPIHPSPSQQLTHRPTDRLIHHSSIPLSFSRGQRRGPPREAVGPGHEGLRAHRRPVRSTHAVLHARSRRHHVVPTQPPPISPCRPQHTHLLALSTSSRRLKTTSKNRHTEAVWGVAFDPAAPTQLASGAEDGTVLVTNVGPYIGQ